MSNSQRLIAVSGGSKGIGRAIIGRFAAGGFAVATFSRNEKNIADLKEELLNQFPSLDLYCGTADASNKEDVKRFGKDIIERFGRVDVLVNNAGIFVPGEVLSEEDGIMEKLFHTNLSSAYHLSRAVVPQMKKQDKAHIFNICSVASLMAYPNGGSYTISKFALLGLSKSLREELKKTSVRVTAVMPGATRTESWAGTDLPEERFMKPEDVAEAIWTAYHLSENTVLEEMVLRPQKGDI